VMTIGNGVVLVGMGERTSAQAVVQLAHALLGHGAATAVIAAQLPRASTATHLDGVFSQCAPDVVIYRPDVVDQITCLELRLSSHGQDLRVRSHAGKHLLDVLAETLDVPTLRAIATGVDSYKAEREPWDDGNGVLALAPGTVIGYDRNVATNKRLRQAGIEVIEIPGGELARAGDVHAMGCPIAREAVSYRVQARQEAA
jgi:arginine deiminase